MNASLPKKSMTIKENNAKKVILSEYIVYIFYLLLLLHLICNITPAMQIVFTKKEVQR